MDHRSRFPSLLLSLSVFTLSAPGLREPTASNRNRKSAACPHPRKTTRRFRAL